jgi:hypothetical protein
MSPTVLWRCLLGLAAPALLAWFTVALKLRLNTRLFMEACVRLLERRDHSRVEKLLGNPPCIDGCAAAGDVATARGCR